MRMIDTHHHFTTDFYAHAVNAAGGDPSGWHVPDWSPEATKASLSRNKATTAILSLTAPGACIVADGENSRALARRCNDMCAQLRDREPATFGFFATLPSLLDTQGAIAEIDYALDQLKADGVTLFTRYGTDNHYLGHEDFEPIWKHLHEKEAVVFVHPTHPVDTNRVNPFILQPSLDYPHETTRTAVDLILRRNRSRYPGAKVILSHAGGTLPWLFSRTSHWRRGLPSDKLKDGLTYEQFTAEFRSFYFDLALSSSHQVLDLLLKLVPHDHVLYGSDFPYAPQSGIDNFREDLESYTMSQQLREEIYYKNALQLFPRLQDNSRL